MLPKLPPAFIRRMYRFHKDIKYLSGVTEDLRSEASLPPISFFVGNPIGNIDKIWFNFYGARELAHVIKRIK